MMIFSKTHQWVALLVCGLYIHPVLAQNALLCQPLQSSQEGVLCQFKPQYRTAHDLFSVLKNLHSNQTALSTYSLDQSLNVLWFKAESAKVSAIHKQLSLLDQPTHNLWVHIYILSNSQDQQHGHTQKLKLQFSPRSNAVTAEGISLKLNRHQKHWQIPRDIALSLNLNQSHNQQSWHIQQHYEMLVLNHALSILNIPQPHNLSVPYSHSSHKGNPSFGLNCQIDEISAELYELKLSLQQAQKSKKKPHASQSTAYWLTHIMLPPNTLKVVGSIEGIVQQVQKGRGLGHTNRHRDRYMDRSRYIIAVEIQNEDINNKMAQNFEE